MKSNGGYGTSFWKLGSILVLGLIATQLVGCGWYLRPTCRPGCNIPYYDQSAFAGGPGGAGGYGAGENGAGGAGGAGQWDGDGAGKTRLSGEPKFMLDTVYFDFDRYDIRSDQVDALERNLAWLRQNPGAPLRVEGHCDERGTEEYNLALGDRRADAVRNWLINHGVDASRLQSVSKGELEPADPGHGESAWSKNRRAEFLVLE